MDLVDGTLAPTVQTWIKLGPIDLMDFYLKVGKQQFFTSIKTCLVNDEFGVPEEHALDFGEYTYPHNLHYYVGQLNPITRKPHGLGRRISSKSGRILEGQFENGAPSGYARYIWDNGDYYIGMQKDSLANGVGRLVRSNGLV